MTRRGRLALLLGGSLYLVAWAFGSRPLYPVAVGLVVAAGLAAAWVRLGDRPVRLHRRTRKPEHVEGEDVALEVEVDLERRALPASLVLVERSQRLGERTTRLARRGRRASARYVVSRLPRGRYSFEDCRAVVEDPFGLYLTEVRLPSSGGFLVFPRLVALERLFSEGGPGAHDGRRLLLRRPAGFDFHSVREYEHGESLRRVHWPSTARKGELMVKELEDSPRDEVAVVLDAQRSAEVGTPPDSSFELQVRAAGSLLRSHAARARRAVLVVNGRVPEVVRIHSYESDWRAALTALAAAEPDGDRPLAGLLIGRDGPAADAQELVVVTASLTAGLADRLVQKAYQRHAVSLVWVDAASFNGAVRRPEPDLLRVQTAGIPVAVLRRGDDLRARLSAGRAARAAVG